MLVVSYPDSRSFLMFTQRMKVIYIEQSQVPSVSHPKSRQPRPSYPPLENRKCPVPGCDSQVCAFRILLMSDWWLMLWQGHLSGKLERHFTHDACPTFHNTTAKVHRCNDISSSKLSQSCAGLSRYGERMGQKRRFQKKSAFSASNQVTNAQC